MDIVSRHISIDMDKDEANALYNGLTVLLREANVDNASERDQLDIPGVYKLYDLLYQKGFNGS